MILSPSKHMHSEAHRKFRETTSKESLWIMPPGYMPTVLCISLATNVFQLQADFFLPVNFVFHLLSSMPFIQFWRGSLTSHQWVCQYAWLDDAKFVEDFFADESLGQLNQCLLCFLFLTAVLYILLLQRETQSTFRRWIAAVMINADESCIRWHASRQTRFLTVSDDTF